MYKRFLEVVEDKLVFIGNLVRKEILLLRKNIVRKNLLISDEKRMVFCYGGSGGLRKINDVMRFVIKNMVNEDIVFIFVIGKSYYDEFMGSISDINFKLY